MPNDQLQFLSNSDGDVTAVVVPIEQWREISSELETTHLLKSEAMKARLLAARGREEGVMLEEVVARFDQTDADE